MAREAGAKKVYFASAAPAVRYINMYGIDIPTREELIAHNRTAEEVAQAIGADQVIYNDLEDLVDSVRSANPTVLTSFDCSCFDGVYVTGDVTPEKLEAIEEKRGKGRKGAVGTESGGKGVVVGNGDVVGGVDCGSDGGEGLGATAVSRVVVIDKESPSRVTALSALHQSSNGFEEEATVLRSARQNSCETLHNAGEDHRDKRTRVK